ncbi:2-(1,2-epoxy-1,2-dihydrophenyl)acetyl-CoA isomerase PaaG [Methylobacterium frigidaeris]|uniref:1,2-epoxyphenylacetyl-CoA isomerase n=1 Tax=Methylobacterium frigidaeris TaxID=2038277 RepID=A0AA37M2F9_9HYPH|nr:2-(1,2-epoxy-1,2-dihydrophenyl)acetyl-CoA isomerase PaaG [Methylobacterium frigidaeris]PIK69904.1 2-(1,2-epoxy-1,2-dihydrophenyl)acetyl-CoA isomerase [Methylobacterium frigidaeris]GJD60217.1 1,2-epoxyphenylacetyl-CoA isomerase [Methylobacterium frigidaeris]
MSEATGETLVLTERHAGYRVLVLNRPDRLNAFNEPLHLALREALSDAAADPECRALILTGAGRGFCAGQDLAARNFAPDVEPDLSRTLEAFYNPLVKQIRDLPMPLICAVNGVAAGAGASLAFHGDLVLAARSAKFLQAFAKLGLIPDAGGTWLLPRLAGRARARGMALLAEPITAEQAESWGMIWRVVDDAELMAEAHRLAAHLAQAPTYGLALIRRALDASETSDLAAQLDVERDLQGEAGRSPDYREGVAAFLEKRPARFTGRSR